LTPTTQDEIYHQQEHHQQTDNHRYQQQLEQLEQLIQTAAQLGYAMLSSPSDCRWGFDWESERDAGREMVLVPGLVRLGGGDGGGGGGGEG
jgi:hypothetical protein